MNLLPRGTTLEPHSTEFECLKKVSSRGYKREMFLWGRFNDFWWRIVTGEISHGVWLGVYSIIHRPLGAGGLDFMHKNRATSSLSLSFPNMTHNDGFAWTPELVNQS